MNCLMYSVVISILTVQTLIQYIIVLNDSAEMSQLLQYLVIHILVAVNSKLPVVLTLCIITFKFFNKLFFSSDMFCAGRVPDEDLRRTMKACGGSVMTTAYDLNDSVLGRCEYFEERQIGSERYL